ncbi:MAG TPA: EamA family transporter [Terriglobales bacterium]|nr:EamA family transporter [Terriglobales bacterium]
MTAAQRQQRFAVFFALGLVYFFWGSTYLGIRIAVERIPPALMCGVRFIVAGFLMLAYCAAAGRNIRFNARQLGQMAIVGILLLMGGNLTLSYAEQYVPSGIAALLVASIALWFLVLDSLILGDHRISLRGQFGLGVGIAGLVVLLWPKLTATGALGSREMWWSLALIGGSFSWALGSVLSKLWQCGGSVGSTGWQILFAGIANFIYALFAKDFSHVTWTWRGVSAIAYLVVFGSLVGYTAYIWVLDNAPSPIVSTYAYVNPVVAVFLGWLILHEKVDAYVLAGSAIVVVSVILVTTAKVKKNTALAQEMPTVEAAGD